MIPVLAPLALAASTTALLAIPLTPAVREFLSKRDAGPLVTRKDDGRIDNFAASLRSHCESLQSVIERCRERNVNEVAQIGDEKVLVVGKIGAWTGSAQTDCLVVCAGAMDLGDGFQGLADFYAHADVQSGSNGLFRALLSDGNIEIGDRTQILRWIHAQANLVVGRGCALFGRASAGRSLTLSPECTFERIYAPLIYSSNTASTIEPRTESAPFSKLAQAGMGRSRRHGRVRLRQDEQHFGDLVAIKGLEMSEGACIFGSAKSDSDVHLRSRAEVDGSLVSTKRIHIESGCYVKGPIISEQEIFIDSGVQVGLPGTPTTVSAPRIHLAPGSVLHGTVWARVEGRVGD